MITEETIKKETLELWQQHFSDAKRELLYDGDFCSFLKSAEDSAEAEARIHLQPWLHILEDCIQWLTNLWVILKEELRADNAPSTLVSVVSLVGASCAHAVAVRRMVLSGLDTPARETLRALDEYLCVCIVLLKDPKLAIKFQTNPHEEAEKFFFKNFKTELLKKHLNAVERSIGLEPKITQEMREWRSKTIKLFSEAIHPCFLGSILTECPPTAKNAELHAIGILGQASAASEETLNFACKSIWYFTSLGFFLIFNDHDNNPPLIVMDKENKLHQHAVVGRRVIQTMNTRYWDYEIY